MFDEKRLYLQSVPSLDSWHKDQTNLTSFSRNPQIHHKEPRYGSKKHRSNLSSWLLFPFGRYRVIAQGKWGVVGGYEDRWKSSYLLSSHLVLVGPVSAIGCAAVVKAMIENKERKIDSLTDDLAAGLNIQYTETVLGPLFLFLWGPNIRATSWQLTMLIMLPNKLLRCLYTVTQHAACFLYTVFNHLPEKKHRLSFILIQIQTLF